MYASATGAKKRGDMHTRISLPSPVNPSLVPGVTTEVNCVGYGRRPLETNRRIGRGQNHWAFPPYSFEKSIDEHLIIV